MTSTTIPYNSQDTDYYLTLSHYVTHANRGCGIDHPYEYEVNYEVYCADKLFSVTVEEPRQDSIDECIVTINFNSKGVFRGNIREVKNFFDIVGRTLNVIA